jgi:hypothetical protein
MYQGAADVICMTVSDEDILTPHHFTVHVFQNGTAIEHELILMQNENRTLCGPAVARHS